MPDSDAITIDSESDGKTIVNESDGVTIESECLCGGTTMKITNADKIQGQVWIILLSMQVNVNAI